MSAKPLPKYLGETPLDVATHPGYAAWTPADWAMEYIGRYGQIDGDHHKAWVLDQAARILLGTPVTVKVASWDNGQIEHRLDTAEPPSDAYAQWVEEMLGAEDENGDREYSYEEGTPP